MSTKPGRARKATTRKTTSSRRAATKKASTARRGRGTDARVVAVEILKKHGGPMPVKQLADLVVADRRVTLGGKTPAATVAAKIYTAAKAGHTFRKTDRGHIGLLEEEGSPATALAEVAKGKGKRAERPSEAAMRDADEEAAAV